MILVIDLGSTHIKAAIFDETLKIAGSGIIRGHYPHNIYYSMMANNYGGNIINWAVRILTRDDFNLFFDEAEQASPGCEGLRFNPEITADKGGWSNISLRHQTGDFARSVLESITEID